MNITIVGAAKSGLAAAKLAHKQGEKVFVSEAKTKEENSDAAKILSESGIEAEFGGHSARALQNSELVITSPGVPRSNAIIVEAGKRNIPIISELEYASRFLKNPIAAITGTNGKTTTTSLLAHILQHGGKKSIAAGNIGTPLSELVGAIDEDTIIVAEVSSYQLDRIENFRPKVAAILNISPNHMAYHGTMEDYARAKYRIFENQDENDILIINADDELSSAAAKTARSSIAEFSMKREVRRGAWNRNGELALRFPDSHKEEVLMRFEEIRIPGVHNHYNSMAAVLAARAFEITNENIRDSLMSFSGVEHRLEFVRTLDGVDYINDAKATNINSSWYALSSYNRPIVWIAGGRGDQNDYSTLDELVSKKVKSIVAIGEDADKIFNQYCTKVRCQKARSLEEAVEIAREQAESGDIVLFSPACKSFDMFRNYEHRGEVFKEAVQDL